MKEILDEKYEIKREIGRGGMGVIYEALHLGLNRPVAVKVLHPNFSGDPAFLKRFQREARAMARLDHVNIIQVFDVGEDDGFYYIVMEYFPAKDLKQVLLESGTLSQQEMLVFVLQMSKALSYAHDNGIIHRDIKPANIMVNAEALVKIADFGIAAATDEASVTATGNVIGTPEYMSVEQARGEKLDARSDLYSVGMVMYEMLTGATSFVGISKVAILGKLVYEKDDHDLDFASTTSPVIQKLIRTLLKKDKTHRLVDAASLIRSLTAASSALKSGEQEVRGSDETCLADIPLVEGPSLQTPLSLKSPEVDASRQTMMLHTTPPEMSLPRSERGSEGVVGDQSHTGNTKKRAISEKGRRSTDRVPIPLPPGPNWPRIVLVVAGLAVLVVAFAFLLSGLTEGSSVAQSRPIDQVVLIQTKMLDVQRQLKKARQSANEASAARWAKDAYGKAFDFESRAEKQLDEAELAIEKEDFDQARIQLTLALNLFEQAHQDFVRSSILAKENKLEADEKRAEEQLAVQKVRERREALKAEAKRKAEMVLLRAERDALLEAKRIETLRRADEKKQIEQAEAEALARKEAYLARERLAAEAALATKKRAAEDIKILGERLAELKQSYQERDLQALQNMSEMSDKRAVFLKQIFENYVQVTVEIAGLSATEDEAEATLSIRELSAVDGNRVLPSVRWKDALIRFIYKEGRWGKARW